MVGQKIIIEVKETNVVEQEVETPVENGGSIEEITAYNLTVNNLNSYLRENKDNYLFKLLKSNDPHYSIAAVSKVKGERKQKSNIIEYTFVSDDPLFARQTLFILVEYLVKNYNVVNESESDLTFKYYKKQAERAKNRLLAAEDSLMFFKQKNRIINYYEQSRHLSIERERIANDLSDELSNIRGEKSALKDIDVKMTEKERIILSMNSIDALRTNIIGVSAKLTAMEVVGIDSTDSGNYKRYKELKAEKHALEKELNNSVSKLSAGKTSLEGASVDIVIKEWLKHKIAYDIARAKYWGLKRRLNEYENKIFEYSSIGANINRSEREIKVLEQEYLGYLRNISKSKLSNTIIIRIVDYPSYPKETVVSRVFKKAAFSGLLGLVFIILMLILIDYMDNRIKTVERAEAFTGLSVQSVFPKINGKTNGVDYTKVLKRVSELIIHYIYVLFYSNPDLKQYNVLIVSTREKEGKTYVASQVISTLRKSGNRVLYINAINTNETEIAIGIDDDEEDNIIMDVKDLELKSSSWMELLSETGKNPEDYTNIFVEIPDLLYNQSPFKLLPLMNSAMLVCNARRNWENADKLTLARFRESWKSDMFVVLNRVEKQTLKTVLGYLPYKKK